MALQVSESSGLIHPAFKEKLWSHNIFDVGDLLIDLEREKEGHRLMKMGHRVLYTGNVRICIPKELEIIKSE